LARRCSEGTKGRRDGAKKREAKSFQAFLRDLRASSALRDKNSFRLKDAHFMRDVHHPDSSLRLAIMSR
jgi:hypothetical protein